MKRYYFLTLFLFAAASIFAADSTTAVAPLPSGAEVMKRVLERSTTQAKATNSATWAYDKRQIMEKLDGDDKVKERTVKLYRMRIVQGVPISQLVKVEGRDLSESEIKKEAHRDAALEKQISGRDPKNSVKQRQALITKDLIDYFECKTLRREAVQGHQTLVVSFEGKPGKDDGPIQERLLRRMAGVLWVDEATADVARLEVHLTKGLSLGVMGVLGAVKACKMDLVSKPMADGTWLPENTKMSISARMFVSSVRFQVEETASNFTLEPPEKSTQP